MRRSGRTAYGREGDRERGDDRDVRRGIDRSVTDPHVDVNSRDRVRGKNLVEELRHAPGEGTGERDPPRDANLAEHEEHERDRTERPDRSERVDRLEHTVDATEIVERGEEVGVDLRLALGPDADDHHADRGDDEPADVGRTPLGFLGGVADPRHCGLPIRSSGPVPVRGI